MAIFLLILGLLLFIGLVVVHEFGHFIMARRGGVEVEEFGIGFPPRAKVLKKRKGTVFTLNWLPLGGFVKLKGEHDSDRRPGSFGTASLWTKVKIMTAGVVMNLLTAFVLLTVVAAAGMPQLIDNQFTVSSDTSVIRQDVLVADVESGSPADDAGIKQRDKIVAINGQAVTSASELPETTKSNAGQSVEVLFSRDGQENSAEVTLRSSEEVEASLDTDEPKGHLGIVPGEFVMQRSTWSSPIVAGGLIGQFTAETFRGLGTALGNLFSGDTAGASEQVAGPVGIYVVLRDGSLLGYQFVLLIVALISLTLAIMNILPIPALDGGRLFVTLLFRALRKPLTKKTEDLVHGAGFVLLITLFVLITIVDVNRISQ